MARALSSAISRLSSGELVTRLADPTRVGSGRLSRALAGAYGPLVRRSPAGWGLLYRSFSPDLSSSLLDRFLRWELAPAMSRVVEQARPRVVVVCHPLLGAAARSAAGSPGGAAPRLVTVVTDLLGGHVGWLSARPELFLTPTARASDWCRAHGVPAPAIRETGLPVDPELAQDLGRPGRREEAREHLGLDRERLCLLLGGGAEGAGRLRQLVQWIGDAGPKLQAVVACGHNRALREWLEGHASNWPLRALGYQESLTPWLRAADVYVGKAGPSSVAEAAAAGLALVLTGSLPGQEGENEAELVSAGAGLRVRGRAALARALGRLADPADPMLAQMRRGSLRWSRPEAAARAAAEILQLI